MYKYASNKEQTHLRNFCDDIIKDVQKDIKKVFTFQYKLIGSGEKRLITKNGNNGEFDLDYNLIIQKDKKDLINYPEKIKQIFIDSFNRVTNSKGFKFAKDRRSVITCKLNDEEYRFSFDAAIMVEANNGNLLKLIHDKQNNRYYWNQVKDSANFEERFKILKTDGYFPQIKIDYLKLKNINLQQGEPKTSYSLLLEVVNNIWHNDYE